MLRATLLAAALLPRVDALSRRRLAAMAVASPSKYRRGGGRPARGGGAGAAESDFVFGVAPVLNALERGGGRREQLHRLHVQKRVVLSVATRPHDRSPRLYRLRAFFQLT